MLIQNVGEGEKREFKEQCPREQEEERNGCQYEATHMESF